VQRAFVRDCIWSNCLSWSSLLLCLVVVYALCVCACVWCVSVCVCGPAMYFWQETQELWREGVRRSTAKTIPSHSLWARSGPTQTHIDTQLHRRFSSVPYGTTFVCPSLLCIALRVCVCALCVCVCVCVCVPGGGLQWRPRSSRYMLLPCVVPVPCVYVCVCVCVCVCV
jgi:hypothetical protein